MRTIIHALLAVLVCGLVGVGGGCAAHRRAAEAEAAAHPPVVVEMRTTRGVIVLELDEMRAPVTVANFLAHAEAGDYDGTIFHRVIPKFVVQGGGFTVDLQERAKIAAAMGHKDVPIVNEWPNGLKNVRGTIAMARDAAPDTATREFYINVADNAKLDTARAKTGNAGYAVFGRVVSGMMVVDQIKDGVTGDRPDVLVDGEGMRDVPIAPVVVLSVKRLSGFEALNKRLESLDLTTRYSSKEEGRAKSEH
jgi:cyclophilin family peptidyl-prolyl cis-trans isomerase